MTAGAWRSTAALSVVTFAIAAAASRVFTTADHLLYGALVIVGGHGLAAVLRSLRCPLWVWIPTVVMAQVLIMGARLGGDTLWWGLPGPGTWQQWGEWISLAGEQLSTAQPPVAFAQEWALLFAVALAALVVTVEVIAHGVGWRRWSLAPGGVVFVALIVFGRGNGSTLVTAAYLLAVLTALTMLRPDAPWLGDPTTLPRHRVRLTFGALAMVAVVAATGVVTGPVLPGSSSDALVPVRGRGGGVLLLDNPLVDVRGRLVDQSTDEMFRITAPRPSYWRLASLAEFDGVTFGVARRRLARLDAPITNDQTLLQQVEIVGLPGRLVPAAPEPFASDGPQVRLSSETAALVNLRTLIAGDRFAIASVPPVVDMQSLMSPATSSAVTAPDALHLVVPTDLPDSIALTALEVVSSAGLDAAMAVQRPYIAALTLQEWFRREFTYTLDIEPGHDVTAMVTFLESRQGYCEQFAAAFAAMARTLGIPSRVAVGFTPGEPLPEGGWSVQGRHSHAWPEIWFAEAGWVGFEPTPGRGAPGAEAYTGVTATQDGDGGTSGAVLGGGPGVSDPTTGDQSSRPTAADLAPMPDLLPDVAFGDESGGTSPTGSTPLGLIRNLLILAAVLGSAGSPTVRWLRRTRRARLTAARALAVTWPGVEGWLRGIGVPITASMTPREIASLTARHHPDVARRLEPVITQVERSVYAPAGTLRATTSQVLREVELLRRLARRKRRRIDRIADHLRPWRD
jgi:transglutaminase-like putative cysteine protease